MSRGRRGTTETNPRLKQMLDFIREYCLENQYPPTFREIGAEIEASTSVVSHYADLLVAEGKLRKTEGTNRTLIPVDVHFVREPLA